MEKSAKAELLGCMELVVEEEVVEEEEEEEVGMEELDDVKEEE